MKRFELSLVVVGVCALVASVRAGEASCVLRITYDAENLPLTFDAVDALLGSSGVLGEAMQAVDDLVAMAQQDGRPLADCVSYSFKPVSGRGSEFMLKGLRMGVLMGQLSVEVSRLDELDPGPLATQVMAGMCMRLQALLGRMGRQDLEDVQRQLEAARQKLAESRAQLSTIRALEKTLCDEAGVAELSRDVVLGELRGLAQEAQEVEMTLMAAKARHQALVEQIALTAQRVEERVGQDPVIKELEQIVEIRARELQHFETLQAAGRVSATELDERRVALAQARAELARQRQDAASAAGGDLLTRLNRELAEGAAELAELEARLGAVRGRVEDLQARSVVELAGRYEDEVSLQLRFARDAVQQATIECDRLERQVRSFQPPVLTVLGGVGD